MDAYTKTVYFAAGSAATNNAWEWALRTMTKRASSRQISRCLNLVDLSLKTLSG